MKTFRPFTDLINPLPDGTTPILVAAEMASGGVIDGAEIGITVSTDNTKAYANFDDRVFTIFSDFDLDLEFTHSPGLACNQVKVHNYLRSLNFNVDGVGV